MVKPNFCIMCGEKIAYRYSCGTGKYYPICNGLKCLEKYLEIRERAALPIISKTDNVDAYYQTKKLERYDGFCGRCGKPLTLDFRNRYFRHLTEPVCKSASATRIKKEIRKPRKPTEKRIKYKHIPNRHPLKPWKDPESLFCSPKLKDITGKEPRSGKECMEKKS